MMSDCEEPCGWPVLDCQLSTQIAALEAALAKADTLAFRFSSMIATMGECEDHAFNDDKIALDAYYEARKELQGKEVHPD